tara:strand:- start:42440 stop:42823 length:384 start_codon:yes stop_codon:yes gene_type:complete
MLSDSLKEQIKTANNNVFMSKEISERIDTIDAKKNTLRFKIFSKDDIFEFELEKFKNKKNSFLIAFEVSKQDLAKYLNAKIKKISLILKDDVLFSLDTTKFYLEYGIVKKDINKYMLKIKIQKEKIL